MTPFLNRVTITGADSATNHLDLFDLSERFPFVEWAILLSEAKTDSPRYPSYYWMQKLVLLKNEWELNLHLAAHICGRWVRDICEGQWTVPTDFIQSVDRIQLNFSPYVNRMNHKKFIDGILNFQETLDRKFDFIFQLHSFNHSIVTNARDAGLNVGILFDQSGGKGVLAKNWPPGNDNCGYAGGLSPENLSQQLPLIANATTPTNFTWIDTETGIRTDNFFSLQKCQEFLELSESYVK